MITFILNCIKGKTNLWWQGADQKWLEGRGGGIEWKGMREFFRVMDMFSILIMMVAVTWVYIFIKKNWTIHLKWVYFIVWKLYLIYFLKQRIIFLASIHQKQKLFQNTERTCILTLKVQFYFTFPSNKYPLKYKLVVKYFHFVSVIKFLPTIIYLPGFSKYSVPKKCVCVCICYFKYPWHSALSSENYNVHK